MSDKERVKKLAELKGVKDITPVEIIREIFNLGWEVHKKELVLYELDRIEGRLTHYKPVVEACYRAEAVGHVLPPDIKSALTALEASSVTGDKE